MKHLLFLFISLTIISCNNTDNSTYKISGNVIGFEEGTNIFVFKIDDKNQSIAIDTLVVKDNKISGVYSKSDVLTINYLQIENTRGNILYFPENTDLEVLIDKNDLASSYITGSKQNDSYKEHKERMNGFNNQRVEKTEKFKQARRNQDVKLASQIQEEIKDIALYENAYKTQFVKENPNSLFSVLLLSEMVNRKDIPAMDAAIIANKFSPKISSTQSGKSLITLIASLKKADVGGLAPNFSAATPQGEKLALNDVLGKYTIIDFWASWCKPCRRENPNVVRVYNEYHDKGLNIISVSLDKAGQKERWIKAIEDDKMNWHHVSNLQGWNEPIAKMYSVRSIPATFLLDEKGNIIAKNLRGNALDAKIASLLGN
ncbi:MAG: TlpA disulfide reductase family protein [Flavobacteriaceae bacterium]